MEDLATFRLSQCSVDNMNVIVSVTLEELEDLADNMRPYMTASMKIEVAPWVRDYVVNMEELHTDLHLERIERRPTGIETIAVQDYRHLFLIEKEILIPKAEIPELEQDSKIKKTIKKILAKGHSGTGKTTFCKKVAWDWAKGIFTTYSIVFFVLLKLVKPGDAIENVIIQQHPYLKGLRIGPQKLQAILKSRGGRCLLILDGLDQHALGSNADIFSIIRGEKYLYCSIILTSRPHRGLRNIFQLWLKWRDLQ